MKNKEEILKIANDLADLIPDKIHKSDVNDMEHIKANLKAGIILQLKTIDIYAQQEAIAFANWLQYQEMDGRSTEKLYKDFKEAIG